MKMRASELAETLDEGPFTLAGGYPKYWVHNDNTALCCCCARKERKGLWTCGVHWEGEPLECGECEVVIESAYGPLDGEEIPS